MKYIYLILSITSSLYINFCAAQTKEKASSKFFLSTGYGLAGSFFVRSYQESLPFPSSGYKAFFKKNFIGNAQNIAFGIHLKKKIDLKVGLNFQHFTRQINSKDTLSGVLIYLDHTIHHRNYIWYASINKKYPKREHQFSWGLGLYYIRSQQEEVEISPPRFYQNLERNLEEAGSFIELAYEYKFQPKVNIGIKTQFYYTISTGEPESVTLFPFIKINF